MTKPLAILIGLLVLPLAAEAKPKGKGNAKAHIERATKAHQEGKYQVALSELETAYSIDPQPKLLYAIAQTYAKLDNCTRAVDYYEKFLVTIKDKAKQEVVKQAIAACKTKEPTTEKAEDKESVFRHHKPAAEELPTAEHAGETKPEPEPKPEAKPEPKPEPEPKLAPLPPKPMPAVEKQQPPAAAHHESHWYRDPLGDALVIGGVGVTIASYFVYKSALDDLDAAESSTQTKTLQAYQDLVDSAHTKRTYTVILAGSGLTLVAAGVLRYATRDKGRESSGVAFVPTSGGGLITWSGGF